MKWVNLTLRRILIILVCLSACTMQGCNDYEKLKQKAEILQTLLRQMRSLQSDLIKKITLLAQLEKQNPVPQGAVQALKTEILSEQTALNKFRQKWTEGIDEAIKELKELDEDDLEDVIDYINKNFPDLKDILAGYIKSQLGLSLISMVDTQQAVADKMAQFDTIMDAQNFITQDWGNDPFPAPTDEVNELLSIAAGSFIIEFTEEFEMLEMVENLFDAQGPLPVRADSEIEDFSFTIGETLPPAFEPLVEGDLAPGSTVYLQLPSRWALTNPLDILSSTLELDICGNDIGSNFVRITVLEDATPSNPDDHITIDVNGIQIDNQPGIVQAAFSVLPGRTTSFSFLVVPPDDCPPIQPSADINRNGLVELGDFSILAFQWLDNINPIQ